MTLEGRTAAMKDASDDAVEVGDMPAGHGGTLFDIVENIEDGGVGAGGGRQAKPDHAEIEAETPRDGGRKSVEDAEQKVMDADAPRPAIGRLSEAS